MRGAITRFDGRNENMRAAIFAGKASITTDGTGTATITHGLGFVPVAAQVQAILGATPVFVAPVDLGTWTTTTFKVRAWTLDSVVYVGSLSAVTYELWG